MAIRKPLINGKVYHVYNRGAHKNDVFLDEVDRQRFQLLLHMVNGAENVALRNLFKKHQGKDIADIFFAEQHEHTLVDVLGYCMMPNHFHLILKQRADGGISEFMRRLTTAFTMHFNIKYEHSGVVFQGRYKSKHVDSDTYFQWLFTYVHLNPLDLLEPSWKVHSLTDVARAQQFIENYAFSSFIDHSVRKRSESELLCFDGVPNYLRNTRDLKKLLAYYQTYPDQGSTLVY